MKWVTLAVASAALVFGLYATVVSASQRHTISELRAQVGHARAIQARAERIITAQQAKLAGEHRDLVTCGDLQAQNAMIDGIVSPQGDFGPVEFVTPNGGVVSSLPLPAHCVNQ